MKRYKFPSSSKNFFINYNQGPYPEKHCHEYWEFTIVTKGRILHKIGNLERIIPTNTLLVLRPDDAHSFHAATEESFAYITFGVQNKALETMFSILPGNLYEFLLKGTFIEFEISKATAAYFNNSFNKFHTSLHDENKSDEILSVLFLGIVRELLLCINTSKQKENYSTTVNNFIEYMRKPENLTLSITDIIKNMNYSHCHLIRLFKKETGTTPSQYFLKIKLNYARSLLETTNLSALDIAYAVGFSSLGHFTEVFKNEYSLPPVKYRKKWNNFYSSFDEVNQ